MPAIAYFGVETATVSAVGSDASKISKLIAIGSDPAGIKKVQALAAQTMKKNTKHTYPTKSCAATLSHFLREAGINIPITLGAQNLADRLRLNRKWAVIQNGKQKTGDVGVCKSIKNDVSGADHIYLVIQRKDADLMMIADNQAQGKTHPRYVSGKGGKTPTDYFLRATGSAAMAREAEFEIDDEIDVPDEDTNDLPEPFMDDGCPRFVTADGSNEGSIADDDSLASSEEDFDDGEVSEEDTPTCSGMEDASVALESASGKPKVEWDPSPFNWSRGGADIDTVVMHYTTSRNLSGTVNWFKDKKKNKKKTAAHYVIGRDGKIVQMVKDKDACTHGNSQNKRSIGIEHSAAAGDAMTAAQEASSAALVRWLMREYDIDAGRVIGHKCAPRDTNCPGDLFKGYGATSISDCSEVTEAIQKWVKEKVVG